MFDLNNILMTGRQMQFLFHCNIDIANIFAKQRKNTI